ncbi:MAG: flippase-like domain-containing protein [Anaerolineae bacterium]|nr:flippase-like domain-containing protein [Anaerolineae bacterium]
MPSNRHSADQPGEMSFPPRRSRSRLILRLRLVIAFGLMAVVIGLVASNRDKLINVNWKLIPLAWLLMLLSTVVKSARWGILVHQSAMNLSFRRLLGTYLVGAFFSTILPTSVGGDAVRAVDTAAKTGRVADSTSSVLIERGIGLLSIFGMASAFAYTLEVGVVPHAFIMAVYAAFVGGLVGLIMLRQGWFIEPIVILMTRLRLHGLLAMARSLQAALSEQLLRPSILLLMFLLSIVANALTMGATYLVLIAVRDTIPLAAFVPMIALSTVAEMLPISIAALGVKESAYIFFLGLAGVSSGEASVIAIIMRVLTWALALVGGVVFLARTVSSRSEGPRGDAASPPAERVPVFADEPDLERERPASLPTAD